MPLKAESRLTPGSARPMDSPNEGGLPRSGLLIKGSGLLQFRVSREKPKAFAQDGFRSARIRQIAVYAREGCKNSRIVIGVEAHHELEVLTRQRRPARGTIQFAKLQMAGVAVGILGDSSKQNRFG